MRRCRKALLPAILAALPCIATSDTAGAQPVDQVRLVSIDPVTVAGPNAPVMRVTYPATGRKLSVVILSHGNRLSRTDYQPLVMALARAGHVVIQPDHPDASVDGFMPAAPQPDDSWRTRVDQLRWIAGHVRQIANKMPGLGRRIDATRIAIVGHSFGGHSAALASGATVEGQATLPPIAGIGATVMLAPPGHFDGLTTEWKARATYLRTDWSTMRGPALIINGDKDMTPLTDRGPRWHDDGFTRAPTGQDICLMTIPGVGHYLGGIDSFLRPPAGDATPERRAAVLDAVVTYLGAHLDHRATDEARWQDQRRALTCK